MLAAVVLCSVVTDVGTAITLTDGGASAQTAEAAGGPPSSDGTAPLAADPAVRKQLAFVLAHWRAYDTKNYGVDTGNDCVNFASQSLVARGWKMDANWWSQVTPHGFQYSAAWLSSTAFAAYLAESGRATALNDGQRDQVKVGDVVQFDWDNSGDRDHTGVVTRIDRVGGRLIIYYAGHTNDTDYRSVDWAISVEHPGASVYYWSIP